MNTRKVSLRTLSISLAAVAAVALSVTAMAQPWQGQGAGMAGYHGPAKMLARLSETLDLDEAQTAELLAVLQQAEADRQALHDAIMAQFGDAICAQRDQTESDILAILTPEQAEQFLAFKDRADDRGKGKRGRGKGVGGNLDCSA